MPFGSTTNVVRSQYIVPLYSVWPTSRAVSRFAFVSASRSIEKPNLLQKDLCAALSELLPTCDPVRRRFERHGLPVCPSAQDNRSHCEAEPYCNVRGFGEGQPR